MSCCEPTLVPISSSSVGPVLSELLSVANIAALAPLTYGDGTGVYVRSVRDYWVYRVASTATADAITVVAHSSGTGRWERLNQPHASWGRQDAWYVDPAGGNNENDGLTSGTALLTVGELLRRVGARWVVNNYSAAVAGVPTQRDVHVYLLGDITTEVITIDILSDRSTTVWFHGVRTAATTTTLSAVPTDQNGNTPAEITGASWTVANEVLRLIHAPATDAYTWVVKDNGSSKARVGPWGAATQGSSLLMTVGTGPTNGQTITTYTVSKVSNLNLRVAGGNGSRGVVIEDLWFDGYLSIAATGGQHNFNRCRFGTSTFRWNGSLFGFVNCLFSTNPSAALGNDAPAYNNLNGGAVMATITSSTGAKAASLTITGGTVFQGAGLTLNDTKVRFNTALFGSGALFCDVADPIKMTAGSEVRCTAPPAGTGVTGYGMRFTGCSKVLVDSGVTPLLTGASGDFCFGRASGVPGTQANAYAVDPATGLVNPVKRTLSWANLAAAYASAGFGGFVQDALTGCLASIN